MKLDDKDLSIIELLQEDSRLSVRDIFKKTGIRPSTVHVRIQKLIKEGVIEKFTLKLNNKAFGEDFIVFMLIKTVEEIDKKIFRKRCVREAFGVTGEYDLMMKLKFPDINAFNTFVLDFRKKHRNAETVTMVSTVVIKEEM